MKKSIIIFILVVYVASIAVVNLFGLEVKINDGTVYVTSIECPSITLLNGENVTIEPYSYNKGVTIFVFDFEPSANGGSYAKDDLTNKNVVQLNIDVLPHNADTSNIKFEYDEETYDDVIVFREDLGAFVFLVPNRIITVTITSTDGSHTSTTVKIIGIKNLDNW